MSKKPAPDGSWGTARDWGPDSYFVRGLNLLQRGELEAARDAFLLAIRDEGAGTAAALQLLAAYGELQDHEGGIAIVEELVDRGVTSQAIDHARTRALDGIERRGPGHRLIVDPEMTFESLVRALRRASFPDPTPDRGEPRGAMWELPLARVRYAYDPELSLRTLAVFGASPRCRPSSTTSATAATFRRSCTRSTTTSLRMALALRCSTGFTPPLGSGAETLTVTISRRSPRCAITPTVTSLPWRAASTRPWSPKLMLAALRDDGLALPPALASQPHARVRRDAHRAARLS